MNATPNICSIPSPTATRFPVWSCAATRSDYDLKVVGDPITAVPVYFILRQDDEAEALVKEIDDTLQEMIDDGTVSSLSEQFLGEDVLQSIDSAAK